MAGFTCSGFTSSGFTTGVSQTTISFAVQQASDTTQTTNQLDSINTITHGDSTKSIKRQGV